MHSRVFGVLTSPAKIRHWGGWLRWRVRSKVVDPVRLRIDMALHRPLSEELRETYFLDISARAQYSYEPTPYPGTVVIFHGEGLYDDPALGWRNYVAAVRSYAVPGEHNGNRDAMADPAVGFVAEKMQGLLELARARSRSAATGQSEATATAEATI